MIELDPGLIAGERLHRQRLLQPIGSLEEAEAYIALFRLLQPVAPVHFSRPGDPPTLVHRTLFHDAAYAGNLRAHSKIVKGRFCGGRVGYVLQEHLDTYAIVFRKPLVRTLPIHEAILAALRTSGGLSKEQLKQELAEYPAGEISKALQALQEAFLVYEQQHDSDWDTGWFDFAGEWFELPECGERYAEAVAFVVETFVRAMVFATAVQIKSWSQLPARTIRAATASLAAQGRLVPANAGRLGDGFVCAEDADRRFARAVPPCTFMLDKSDMLVRAHMDELKTRYRGLDVLQYLLIDGECRGAVTGHWRIGPYDVDDIVTDLPSDEAERRQDEIVAAVRRIYAPERHRIIRYNGTPLETGGA